MFAAIKKRFGKVSASNKQYCFQSWNLQNKPLIDTIYSECQMLDFKTDSSMLSNILSTEIWREEFHYH